MLSALIQSALNQKNEYLGLTVQEARENLKVYGLNSRPAVRQMTWLKRLWSVFTEPMMLFILATAFVYFLLRDLAEAGIVLLSVIPIGLMEFFQERRTDQAIKLLDQLVVSRCHVKRGGQIIKIDSKFLVPGDLVFLKAGDQVPADGVLLHSPGLMIDESSLTGESIAVIKIELAAKATDLKREEQLFQGTLVVQGEGQMLIEKTGAQTVYGQLGNLLEEIKSVKTPLQEKIDYLVKRLAIVAVLCALIVALLVSASSGPTLGLLGGLTVAMSIIPEEFPIVFSVFLIMGVWRMAKRRAMVRHMEMVETLGSATVICTDKTGTLTEGRMSLDKAFWNGAVHDLKNETLAPGLRELIENTLLSLEKVAADPLEVEVQLYARRLKIDLNKFYSQYELWRDSTFNAKTKMVHHVWKDKAGACVQHSAGAPENILQICNLDDKQKKDIVKIYEELARSGYRLIAVAKKDLPCEADIQTGGLNFIGLLAMSDPPRAGVKEALNLCQRAGIRVIMITGDSRLTAHNIAEAIGLRHHEQIITGDDLEKMTTVDLDANIKTCDIFARTRPEQKYLIVDALQRAGEIVAMTGDGVNDAPALKKANIGIAMGKKGTEVARAASGIVLLDDQFTTIVDAVREGRKIYDNLRKAFVFLFSFHLPIVGLAIIPLLFGQPLIFMPIHIIFLELVCDPAAVLGFERERARRNLMEDAPRPPDEPLINPRLVRQTLVQGFSILALCLGIYYYFYHFSGQFELARTMCFSTLVSAQIFLIVFTREWSQIKSNRLLTGITVATFIFLSTALFTSPLRNVFHLVEISVVQFFWLMAVVVVVMAAVSWWVKKSNRVIYEQRRS